MLGRENAKAPCFASGQCIVLELRSLTSGQIDRQRVMALLAVVHLIIVIGPDCQFQRLAQTRSAPDLGT